MIAGVMQEVNKEGAGTQPGYYIILKYCPTLCRGEVLSSYQERVALMKRSDCSYHPELLGQHKVRGARPLNTKQKGRMRIDNQLVRWKERMQVSKDSLLVGLGFLLSPICK